MAERTKAMRVRRRVADQVARLEPSSEDDALRWIEGVSEVDDSAPSRRRDMRRGNVVTVADAGDYGKP